MAEAVIEERQLLKSLHWYDGFVIALCHPAFLLGSLGSPSRRSARWGSVLLWGISATVGLLQNWIYSETAAMFPDKPGGISLYAHEGWRSHFNLFGPIGAVRVLDRLVGGAVVRRQPRRRADRRRVVPEARRRRSTSTSGSPTSDSRS